MECVGINDPGVMGAEYCIDGPFCRLQKGDVADYICVSLDQIDGNLYKREKGTGKCLNLEVIGEYGGK